MKKLALAALSLALITGAQSFAEDAPKPVEKPHATPEERFKKLDADGDGKLTLAEFQANPRFKDEATKAKAAEYFKKMDANSDGSVSLEEYKTFMSAHEHKPGDKPAEKK